VAGVITLTGVDLDAPFGTFAGNYGDGNSASVSVISGSDDLILGVFGCETCNSVSFSAPGVEQWNLNANNNTFGAAATYEGASPTVTLSASLGKGDHWAMGAVAIRPAQ